ncbi:hypothetical protein Bbelb_375290 [Branchiostoma belcheri]|nr:hypothetical protein Bbelb_375290 [Branchiostoma belcheri]
MRIKESFLHYEIYVVIKIEQMTKHTEYAASPSLVEARAGHGKLRRRFTLMVLLFCLFMDSHIRQAARPHLLAGKAERQSHTILLVQPGPRPETRTYSDYDSVTECMEAGVCKIFEEHLKRSHPNSPSITYDISQLFDFIDQLPDLSCLVYQKSTNTYAPCNKEWIKEKIYIMLRKQAGKSA